ncbi:MAG: SMP-30/gluconolactonase/LRE family protein, partial [Pseudomonadota bacterium]
VRLAGKLAQTPGFQWLDKSTLLPRSRRDLRSTSLVRLDRNGRFDFGQPSRRIWRRSPCKCSHELRVFTWKGVPRLSWDLHEIGEPEPFFTLTGAGNGWPDGSCVDAEGALWNARWDGYKVQRIMPNGEAAEAVEVGAPKVSCACFGGPDLDRLYITTAQEGMSAEDLEKEPLSGAIFVAEPGVKGLPEDRYATRLFA